MKLLFDQNLGPSLCGGVADLFPGSIHVRDVGLARADDAVLWGYAADGDFVIVTKDDDFRQRSFLLGAPPKVVWVRLGNCRTADVLAVLRSRHADILEFGVAFGAALLVLSRPG